MKSKYKETAFNTLRLNQIVRTGGFSADPSFVFKLWIALETWFVFIAKTKKEQGKKAVLKYFDIWLYSNELKKILDKQRKEARK